MVFEAVVDTLDMKKKDVLAVGGRYVIYIPTGTLTDYVLTSSIPLQIRFLDTAVFTAKCHA
jgi:hypothetical protein